MLGPREGGRQSKDDTSRKEKFRVVIPQAKGRPDALQHRQNGLVVAIDILWPAHCNAEVDRLERRRVAAPAAVGFLERERLFNPQFSRNRKTFPSYP